ncbi:hypothetical protein [Rubritalea sp.]|uniref:hypothetical protein n=1 Tax=Rubritalea sp. TaxID=2109375 RepID=UPI003EF648F0
MKIPSEKELAGEKPYCLDTEWMLKNFLGVSKNQAIQLFQSTAPFEDFTYMKCPGLLYYLDAALEYLRGDEVIDEEYNFPYGLLCSLMCQVTILNVDQSAIPLINKIVEYCEQNTDKFGLNTNCEYISKIKLHNKTLHPTSYRG